MKATLFVGAVMALFGATHTITAHICDPITQPIITSPATGATLTAGAVTIDGTAQSGAVVVIRVDSNVVAQVTADASNLFTAQIALGAGTHTIDATATNDCSAAATSSLTTVTVTAPSTPPAPTPSSTPLPVTSPKPSPVATTNSSSSVPSAKQPASPNTATGGALIIIVDKIAQDRDTTDVSMIVSGTTSRPATVVIKRGDTILAQTYMASTSYRLRIPLIEGNNDITIIATDENDTVASRHVRYVRKPFVSSASSSKRSEFIWWPMVVLFLTPVTIGGFWWFIVWRRKHRDEDERQ